MLNLRPKNHNITKLKPMKERVSELTYPTLQHCLGMLLYNEWQFQALVTGNRTKQGI